MTLTTTVTLLSSFTRTARAAIALYPVARLYLGVFSSAVLAMFYRAPRQNAYNMLWAVLFGFATLNIIGLAARRPEPRRGLNLGEMMAVLIVLLSIVMLAWEMGSVLHIFPIKLR